MSGPKETQLEIQTFLPTTPTGGEEAEATPEAASEEIEPKFHLDTEGKVRYMWMALGAAVFKERVPLHVFKMDEARKRFHFEQIADKLKNQLLKDMKKYHGNAR